MELCAGGIADKALRVNDTSGDDDNDNGNDNDGDNDSNASSS